MNNNFFYKQKFDSIASKYEKISNDYTISRRAEITNFGLQNLLLEVGSSTGLVSEKIDKNIICSDISYEMCKQCKKKNRQNVICCDAERLPIKQNILDGILSTEMIYYLNNVEDFVKSSHICMKPDTEIVITMFNQNMKFIDRLRDFWRNFDQNQYFDDGQKNFLSLKKLRSILEQNNFEIISIEKKVIFPFKSLDGINRFLEKTFLNQFAYFLVIRAKCKK